jgi:hypothetical protein
LSSASGVIDQFAAFAIQGHSPPVFPIDQVRAACETSAWTGNGNLIRRGPALIFCP